MQFNKAHAARLGKPKSAGRQSVVGLLLAIVLAIPVLAVPGPISNFWYDYLPWSARVAITICLFGGIGIALLFEKGNDRHHCQNCAR